MGRVSLAPGGTHRGKENIESLEQLYKKCMDFLVFVDIFLLILMARSILPRGLLFQLF